MTIIRDPDSQTGLHIDENKRAHTYAVTENQYTAGAQESRAFNINTGLITGLTGSSGHSVLYFYNDEDPLNGSSDIIIESVALWTGTRSATVTDDPVWTILKNPDGGDIITDATAASIKSNANFSVSSSLSNTTLAFKGKNGGTITASDGDHAILAGTGRIFATLPILLGRGDSVGISVDINTSGSCSAYAALVIRKVDGNAE